MPCIQQHAEEQQKQIPDTHPILVGRLRCHSPCLQLWESVTAGSLAAYPPNWAPSPLQSARPLSRPPGASLCCHRCCWPWRPPPRRPPPFSAAARPSASLQSPPPPHASLKPSHPIKMAFRTSIDLRQEAVKAGQESLQSLLVSAACLPASCQCDERLTGPVERHDLLGLQAALVVAHAQPAVLPCSTQPASQPCTPQSSAAAAAPDPLPAQPLPSLLASAQVAHCGV